MIDPDVVPVGGQYAAIVGGAVAVIVGVLNARQKRVAENGEQKVSVDLVGQAAAANKDAREAWDERNKLAGEVGELRAENRYLKDRVAELNRRVASLERKLGIINTDIMPGPST